MSALRWKVLAVARQRHQKVELPRSAATESLRIRSLLQALLGQRSSTGGDSEAARSEDDSGSSSKATMKTNAPQAQVGRVGLCGSRHATHNNWQVSFGMLEIFGYYSGMLTFR